MRLSVHYQLFHLVIYFFKCITKSQTWGSGQRDAWCQAGTVNSSLIGTSLPLCHPLCLSCKVLTVLQEPSPGSLHLWTHLSPNSDFLSRIDQSSLPARPFGKGKHKRVMWAILPADESMVPAVNGFEHFSILSCWFLFLKCYYNKIPQLTAKALSFAVLVLQLWLSALLSLSVTPGTS